MAAVSNRCFRVFMTRLWTSTGEPYLITKNLDDIWGPFEPYGGMTDSIYTSEWNLENKRTNRYYLEDYAVWKSESNHAVIVLKRYNSGNCYSSYLWLDGDDIIRKSAERRDDLFRSAPNTP